MDALRRGWEACTGCGLCLLACPVWRAASDRRLTPQGRARALQCGADAQELSGSVDACTLCGACEPACPENIGLVAMTLDLRATLARIAPGRAAQAIGLMGARTPAAPAAPGSPVRLVPDGALQAEGALLGRMVALLGGGAKLSVAQDAGADIALALECGAAIPAARLERFLAQLRGARRLVVGDGLLLRFLRGWLPRMRIESLGAAASAVPEVRGRLRAGDLYVIEPRAYNADQERLVQYYHAMREELGLWMNLDLQRLAIPTTAGRLPSAHGGSKVDARDQARWILEGRACSRIVVEDLNDIAVFKAVTDRPVVHLAQLA